MEEKCLKVRRKILLLLFVCFSAALLCTHASAQEQETFYRGKGVQPYNLRYNGNYYWRNAEFGGGSMVYNGKLYDGLTLNINAHKQEVLLRRHGEVTPLSLENEYVSWLSIRDTMYVNLRYNGFPGVEEGFFQVMSDRRDVLFKHVSKVIVSDTKDANGELIGYYDPKYSPNIPTYFKCVNSYYILKDGQLIRVRNRKDLKRLYPELKKEVNRYHDLELCATAIVNMTPDGPTVPVLVKLPPFSKWPAQAENSNVINNVSSDVISGTDSDALPSLWFAEDRESGSTVVRYVAGSTVDITFQNKLYELGDKTTGKTGKVKISGFVRNGATEEPLPGVLVSDRTGSTYTQTDAKGEFTLSLPVGENVINFNESSMDDFHAMVSVYDNASIRVDMNEKSTLLEGAVISSESRANHRTVKMGLDKLTATTMKKVPTAFGEGDILRAVQSLPGVQTVGEASSGINVRGGSVDQNLILFNENTIYNPSHLFGIFSAFNPEVVDNVELYKSTIPIEYGGRISSVMNVTSRHGDMERLRGSIGLGLLTSHLTLEGPIKKGKTSFLLAGRTTYSDWLLGLLPEDSAYSDGKTDFSDLNLGINHKFNDRSSLELNAYWSRDGFSFGRDTTFRYANINASAKWNQKIGGKTDMSLSFGYDQYTNSLEDASDSLTAYAYNAVIRQAFFGDSFKTKLGKHELSYGFRAIEYSMDPGKTAPVGDYSLHVGRALENERALEGALWLGDVYKFNDRFSMELGGRLSAFNSQTSSKTYVNPEGRAALKYSFNENFSVKAGAGTATQYINLISNAASISPMDTWKLADDKIKPQTGWQGAAGAYYTAGKYDISLEAYWKRSYNVLDYKSGAVLIMNENLADDLVSDTGKAYGVELMVKKQTGKLTGWVSYTYSRSLLKEMEDRGISTINGGKWYNAPFDKPHDFKLVSNYAFTHRYSLSVNVDYSTGRPVTMPIGQYYMGGRYILAFSERNEYRIPDYFRMDVAMNIEPGHYLKSLAHFSMTFGVYNVTGRRNAYSVYYTTRGTDLKGYMVSVFATPIPYASINIKF